MIIAIIDRKQIVMFYIIMLLLKHRQQRVFS